MSLIGIINTEPKINAIIKSEFEETAKEKTYVLRFLETEKEILEFLNFDLPEIVIINFSDPNLDTDNILDKIKSDAWLHTFGIVALFNQDIHAEVQLHNKMKDLNILSILETQRVPSHLWTCVNIMDNNQQLIFQWDLADKLVAKQDGEFEIENDILAVSVYTGIVVNMLAQRGFINPDTKMHLQLALSELIVNGIEHGNCGINFEEKSKALSKGLNIVDLVEQRCQDLRVRNTMVYFRWEIKPTYSKFIIEDQGEGFDVHGLQEKISKEGPMSLHGRGIQMAHFLAHKIYYNQKGNKVILIYIHEQRPIKQTPMGFLQEESVSFDPKDVIFKEGEESNFLYYISKGNFKVFQNEKLIGKLGPEDIFMGEMSFLLNNRRSATVITATPAQLIKITRKSFISVVKKYPHYGIFLSKLIARKLVRANMLNAGL